MKKYITRISIQINIFPIKNWKYFLQIGLMLLFISLRMNALTWNDFSSEIICLWDMINIWMWSQLTFRRFNCNWISSIRRVSSSKGIRRIRMSLSQKETKIYIRFYLRHIALSCVLLFKKYLDPIRINPKGLRGAVSIRKTILLGMAIPMLKIRRPTGRLIFNMGIPIPGKTVFYIETGPW